MRPEWRGGRSVGRLSALVLGFALLVSMTAGATGGALAAAPSTAGVAVDVSAQEGGSGVAICDRDADTFIGVYNDQSDSIPGLISGRVEDSQIHLQVFGAAGGNYTLDTDNQSQVTAYSEGKPADANLRIETNCETFRNITDADDPGAEFRTAYSNNNVRIIGLGAVNWLVFQTIDTLTDPVGISLVVVAFFLLLVLAYVVYRRLTIYYRRDDDDDPGDEPVADDSGGPGAGQGAHDAGPSVPGGRGDASRGGGQRDTPHGEGRGDGQRAGGRDGPSVPGGRNEPSVPGGQNEPNVPGGQDETSGQPGPDGAGQRPRDGAERRNPDSTGTRNPDGTGERDRDGSGRGDQEP